MWKLYVFFFVSGFPALLYQVVWQRSLFSNPALDANVARPLSQIGENLFQDNLDVEREVACEAAVKGRLP